MVPKSLSLAKLKQSTEDGWRWYRGGQHNMGTNKVAYQNSPWHTDPTNGKLNNIFPKTNDGGLAHQFPQRYPITSSWLHEAGKDTPKKMQMILPNEI